VKIYEQRSKYKKKVHCKICGNEGHLWTTCSVPKKMVELKKQNKEPDLSLYADYFKNIYSKRDPSGRLHYELHIFTSMTRYLLEQENRNAKMKARREARKNARSNKKRVVSCGFCGSQGHNRRNCTVMQDFVSDLSRANQNYRKRFYNKVVQEIGICEGALVQLEAKHVLINNSWKENWRGLGVITKVDWSGVNLGLSHQQWDWKTDFTIDVLVNGDIIKVEKPMGKLVKDDIEPEGELFELFGGNGGGWSPWVDEVIAPSENIPSQEWFNSGYDDCWTWLTKKYTLGQLKTYLLPTISKWHPDQTGSAGAKLKKRLKTYGGYYG